MVFNTRFDSNTKKGDRSFPKFNGLCIAMYKHLNSEQKYGIYLLLKQHQTMTQIARAVGVSVSTISRELKLNRGKRTYSPSIDQEYADEKKERMPGNRCINGRVKQLAIENANKLIRQYIPKNTDFNFVTQDFIKQIQYKINARPRIKLNIFHT